MYNVNASLWTRIVFDVADPSQLDALTLRMKYNDGFVAYLNGREIARSNAPASLQWNSNATASRTVTQSIELQDFNVTGFIDSLAPGTNVLAIHGLNVSAADGNFLIHPNLTAEPRPGIPAGLSLLPGINRVVVQTFEGPGGAGRELQSDLIDIWSDPSGSTRIAGGMLAGELSAISGPYRISGNVTVPAGSTLKIGAGTTLFFDPGASLTVAGRLLAEGTERKPIRFTRTPGGGNWSGIQFQGTVQDNRISHAILEYGVTDNGMIGLVNSNLTLDHVLLDHTDRRRIRSLNSSLVVRNSTFTDVFPGTTAPTSVGFSEHIYGEGIPAGGQVVIENNVFGTTKGRNNAIDFDAASQPGAVVRILDNVFHGGGEDAIELTADAHVEGNVFTHFHKDTYNTGPGYVSVISIGAGATGRGTQRLLRSGSCRPGQGRRPDDVPQQHGRRSRPGGHLLRPARRSRQPGTRRVSRSRHLHRHAGRVRPGDRLDRVGRR